MGATSFETTAGPARDELVLTPEGYAALVDEHRALTAVKRPEASARLSDALEIAGDLADNAEYLHARAELDLIEARIEILEDRLSAARVMRPEEGSGDIVGLGSEVVLEDVDDGTRDEYLLVSSPESNPAGGRLSNESPVGAAIAGRRCGEVVDVRAPHAVRHIRIVGVRGRRRRAARP
jgi:transcription elongation factor GreA